MKITIKDFIVDTEETIKTVTFSFWHGRKFSVGIKNSTEIKLVSLNQLLRAAVQESALCRKDLSLLIHTFHNLKDAGYGKTGSIEKEESGTRLFTKIKHAFFFGSFKLEFLEKKNQNILLALDPSSKKLEDLKYKADYYLLGNGLHKDPKIAFLTFQEAAQLGDLEATYKLGLCFQRGIGTEKNLDEAFSCYQKAAPEIPLAKYRLAHCFEKGLGTQKDLKKAFELYQEVENPKAYYRIAKNGQNADENLKKAASLGHTKALFELGGPSLAKAAAQNHPKANYLMGRRFESMERPDIEKASRYYQHAANLGSSEAQLKLYELNIHDRPAFAFVSLEKAVEQGMPQAEYIMASHFEKGGFVSKRGGLYISKDEQKAFALFQKAAEKGNSLAQYKIGRFHEAKQPKIAFEWYIKAINSPKAHEKLGTLYEEGRGVTQDLTLAFQNYTQGGDSYSAKRNVARCYAHGIGTAQDLQLAVTHYEQALSKRRLIIPSINTIIARLYKKGWIVKKDLNKAIKYYAK